MSTDKNTRIEFLIDNLLGMSSEKTAKTSDFIALSRVNKEQIRVLDQTKFIKRNFKPNHPWLINMGAGIDNEHNDRYFSPSSELLVNEPKDTLGNEFEIYMVSGITLKWAKFARTERKRVRPLLLPNAKDIYEFHFREISFGGNDSYDKRLVGFNGFNTTPIMLEGQMLEIAHDAKIAITLCSVKEDIYRKGVFHVKITNNDSNSGLKLAVTYQEAQELFKYRDSPRTETGRKKPILHWVCKHLRGIEKKAVPTKVQSHIRGIEKFDIDNFSIEISQPELLYNEFTK